jgi:mercuric reductase
MDEKIQYHMDIQGMTCTDCEHHVTPALEAVGASRIQASFRKGEALFWAPPDFSVTAARSAVSQAGYIPKTMHPVVSSGSVYEPSHSDEEYDWVVIGSGSAAFASAIEARLAGARVAMIERGTLGGTCVNIGCVPSKTLLRASDLHHAAQSNPFVGLHTSAAPADLAALVAQKDQLVATLRQKKYADLLPEYGIDLFEGEARFVDQSRVAVGDRVITGGHYLIATGARPRIPEIAGLQSVDYLTSTSALNLTSRPDHLIIIGSGYIALELGQMFRHWGSAVTLVQRGPVLMPFYDEEVRAVIQDMLEDAGIEVITGASYSQVQQDGLKKTLTVSVGGVVRHLQGDALLVAAGRDPNTEALHLDAAGVLLGSRGEPVTDRTLQTANPRIYAAGDVTLGPQFVYVAAYEGKIAVQNALGLRPSQEVNLEVVPAVTFTQPVLASVGLTEDAAEHQGLAVKTSVLPLEAVTRALANRETRGVFKIVADAEGGRIRGVQIVAENAGDVIYAATLAVKFGLTVSDLTDTLAPYLTMAEGLKLAALTFDKDVNKLSCCAG